MTCTMLHGILRSELNLTKDFNEAPDYKKAAFFPTDS